MFWGNVRFNRPNSFDGALIRVPGSGCHAFYKDCRRLVLPLSYDTTFSIDFVKISLIDLILIKIESLKYSYKSCLWADNTKL